MQALQYLSFLPTPLAATSDVTSAHRLVESLNHAFTLRMSLGDPDFVASVDEVVQDMLSPDFNRRLAANASDASVLPPDEYGGRRNPLRTGLPPDRGTSHFSIVDADRNAVAMTTTVNTGFGSKVVA